MSEKQLQDLRVALWGFGNQNKLMAKYLHERHISVVAVISHHDIGEDYGMVDLGGGALGVQTGTVIVGEEDAEATLEKVQADVCILCTRSTMPELFPALQVLAKSKVNTCTIGEEALFSTHSSPEITQQVDELFASNGVTFSGGGYVDGVCCMLPMALSTMMHKVEQIDVGIQYNVDDYGKVVAQASGVGLTKEEFQTQIVDQPQAKSYLFHSNEWIVEACGLTLVETKEEREPTVAKTPIASGSIGKTIPVGDCTGMKVIVTSTTEEGVNVVAEQVGKCYEEGEVDWCYGGFQGEPSGVKFSMNSPPTPEMTNTATISRLAHVVAAKPGYVTTNHMGIDTYRHWK